MTYFFRRKLAEDEKKRIANLYLAECITECENLTIAINELKKKYCSDIKIRKTGLPDSLDKFTQALKTLEDSFKTRPITQELITQQKKLLEELVVMGVTELNKIIVKDPIKESIENLIKSHKKAWCMIFPYKDLFVRSKQPFVPIYIKKEYNPTTFAISKNDCLSPSDSDEDDKYEKLKLPILTRKIR